MKLKNKITLGSIAISLFTSLTLLGAIAYVVKNQNAKASEEILKTAFNIIGDEIQRRQDKLWTDTNQLSNLEDIRSNIRFIRDNKSTVDNLMARDSYNILAETTHTLGKTANAWKMAIYDGDGDLSAFAVFQQKETKYGFAQGFPNAVIKAKSLGDKDSENSGDFQKIDHLEGLDLSFGQKLPEQALWRFERIGPFLCIVTHVPIMGESYNKDTGKMETVLTGLVTGVQKLDELFVKRLSNLTDTEINLFILDGLSVGTLADYKTLAAESGAAKLASGPGLSPELLRFNKISVTGSDYYQATMPLNTDSGQVGTVAAVYSMERARARTFEIVKMLLLISSGCILLIIPITIVFSMTLTKPIRLIISGLNASAERVAFASDQISSASRILADGTTEQAASIEETSASLEEMTSTTHETAKNADQATGFMHTNDQVVNQANEAMTRLTDSIRKIDDASKKTANIVKTIDEIAFQTNLLALNASVEAARAGEAGAGFAVVAEEVRSLALRAAKAARDTTDLIEETSERVKDGSTLLVETNVSFEKVADTATKVGGLVDEIASAAREQASGIEQLNKAMTDMEKIVQENAAGAEELSSAFEEISVQAIEIKTMVGELTALVSGGQKTLAR